MNKCISLIFTFIILISLIRSQKLEFLEDPDEENNIVNRKRLEDIIKWTKRYIDESNPENSSLDPDVVDYVMKLERPKLIQVAYILENYHRKVNHQEHLLGGLHDYVFKISDDQIRNFVFKELKEHPGISNKLKLNELAKESDKQTEESKKSDRDFVIGGGIHDYVHGLERPKLNKLAIALENYHRKEKDELIFGGLHDYIGTITDEDLLSYIAKEANEHPEINKVSALKALIDE